ncbi:hypothetical protein IF1G_04958 [Cordyceps javanica]|uniref:Uncharacterized protein n=1 Tax=Cordyceps javanica TaxID=43265 RepID=A0A545V3U4_9HYPO|nr:hypothetical protein IF1G_04958 [Cordyceps javanica]
MQFCRSRGAGGGVSFASATRMGKGGQCSGRKKRAVAGEQDRQGNAGASY